MSTVCVVMMKFSELVDTSRINSVVSRVSDDDHTFRVLKFVDLSKYPSRMSVNVFLLIITLGDHIYIPSHDRESSFFALQV